MHILLVDDSEDIRAFYAQAFSMKGHTVRQAGNGVEAVAAVSEEVFDVILLDIQMPVMDGWQVLAQIATLPQCQSAIIALLSAGVAPREMTAAHREGAHTVFHKPIMPAVILDEVERLMAERRAE